MEWLVLIASGSLEAVWAAALAASNGLRRWRPVLIFIVSMCASVGGLGWAMQYIPTGTAYAVWTGVGATLAVIWAIVSGKEKPTRRRIAFLVLLVSCIVGLKIVS